MKTIVMYHINCSNNKHFSTVNEVEYLNFTVGSIDSDRSNKENIMVLIQWKNYSEISFLQYSYKCADQISRLCVEISDDGVGGINFWKHHQPCDL